MARDGPTLSVVLPMFDEAPIVEEVIRTVVASMETTGKSFELVCVDDGSSDGTAELLTHAAEADSRIVVVPLSRNFGKESALAAGLSMARGDAVVLMDADLQHPPELVGKMVELWEQGNDVVSAVKRRRAREGLVYALMARTFNFLMGGAAGASFEGASDFKLLDRQVVDTVMMLPERARFFRGLVTWVGYRTADVPFAVQERVGGRTKWSFSALARYSVRNLVAFSALPLRLVAWLGFGTLIFAFLLALQTLYRYLRGDALSGFTTVILLQLILGGLLLTGVGVIALYLSAIYDEVKQRPIFVVRRARGEGGRSILGQGQMTSRSSDLGVAEK